MEQTIQIDFRGDEVTVVVKDNIPYVALKPIAEALGLAWNSQVRNIKRSRILSKGMLNLSIPSDGGEQEMTCLPLKYLNGWLFRIDLSRYTGERLERLEEYQAECYDVLFDYFQHGGAVNPEAMPSQLAGLQGRIEYYQQFTPMDEQGTESRVSGLDRVLLVRSYFRAHPRKSSELHPDLLDLIGFPEE